MIHFIKTYKYPFWLGLSLGILVLLDAFISAFLHLKMLNLPVQYIPSLFFFILGMGLMILLLKSNWLWQKKTAIFMITLIMSSQLKGLTSFGPLDLSDFIVIAFLGVFLIENFTDHDYKIVVTPFIPLILFFILSMVLSHTSVISATRSSFPFSLVGPAKWLFTILLMLNFIRKKEDDLFLIKTFVTITAFSGIIGITESLLYLFAKISFHSGEFDFERTVFGTFLRAQAFFGQIHGLATLLTICLAFLFGILIAPKRNILWKKRTATFWFVIILISNLFTLYKACWIALGFVVIMGLFMIRSSHSIHFTAGLLLITILFFSLGIGKKLKRMVSSQMYMGDFKARIQLNKEGIEGFLHGHPFVGTGLRNNRIYTPHPTVYPAHNAFIQIADELGIFGLVTYCMIFVYLFFRLISTCLLLEKKEEKNIIKALLLSFIAFFIHAQFDPLAYNFWYWVYFGLLECTSDVFLKNPKKEIWP